MEPIATPAIIAGIVAYLATQVAKNKSVTDLISDLTDEAVQWFRDIFLKKDGTEKEEIQQLRSKPDSSARQNVVKSKLVIAVEENPEAEKYLREMFEKIKKTEAGKNIVNTIINSKNVITGNVENRSGDFRIGDGN